MGFWGSLFGGASPTLNKAIPQAGQVSQFSTGLGENLATKSGNFMSDLLSGDPSKSAQLLAPQTQAMRDRAQQGKQTLSQFGTRSGGTAAQTAGIDAATRSGVNNMVSSLTGNALTGAANMGESMIDTGMRALNQQVGFSQQQMENWSNSIAGMGMTTAIGAAEKFALGGMGG